jgi:hypothetical protein
MMRGNDPVDSVQAPIAALAWSTSAGWLVDPVDVLTAEQSGELVSMSALTAP